MYGACTYRSSPRRVAQLRDHRLLPPLRVAEEELHQVRAPGPALRQGVALVDVGTDPQHAPSLATGCDSARTAAAVPASRALPRCSSPVAVRDGLSPQRADLARPGRPSPRSSPRTASGACRRGTRGTSRPVSRSSPRSSRVRPQARVAEHDGTHRGHAGGPGPAARSCGLTAGPDGDLPPAAARHGVSAATSGTSPAQIAPEPAIFPVVRPQPRVAAAAPGEASRPVQRLETAICPAYGLSRVSPGHEGKLAVRRRLARVGGAGPQAHGRSRRRSAPGAARAGVSAARAEPRPPEPARTAPAACRRGTRGRSR